MTSHDATNLNGILVGSTMGLASLVVPDSLVHFTVKILVGVITAFLSGMAYKLGTRLMEGRKK